MVKNLILTILTSFLLSNTANAFSFTNTVDADFSVLKDSCDVPPPDNFRITGIGYDFVSLAWDPVSLNSSYFLTVFKKNQSNAWDSLYSVIIPPSSSFTAYNLPPSGTFKFRIHTICLNGHLGPGGDNGPTSLIVDLTTTSFSPPSTSPAPNCAGLKLPTQIGEWVGFEVSANIEGQKHTTLFEFKQNAGEGDAGWVKRVQPPGSPTSKLVAGNLSGFYPLIPSDEIKSALIFQIGRRNNNGTLTAMGFLETRVFNTTVDICPIITPDFPWSPDLTFIPKVVGGGGTQGLYANHVPTEKFFVQNPVSQYLNVFFLQEGFKSGKKKITIQDIGGVVKFNEVMDVSDVNLSIPIGQLSNGIYILCIENGVDVQKSKVLIMNY